jgi:ribosomal protein S18 acetylase RimI-like enzyme
MQPLLDPACVTAVAALEHDPFYRCITAEFAGDDKQRHEVLARYFDYSIQQGARIGRVVHLEPAEMGVAVWTLPQSDEVQEHERSRKRGALHEVLGATGFESYVRIVDLMSARAHSVVAAGSWYLSIIAVAREAQGRGLGARLLAPTLAEADAASAACYLETFNPRSLHFYQRLGFETRAQVDEPATQARYAIMVRAPHKKARS